MITPAPTTQVPLNSFWEYIGRYGGRESVQVTYVNTQCGTVSLKHWHGNQDWQDVYPIARFIREYAQVEVKL